MYIQLILKGIPDINDSEADTILQQGIICNWWRRMGKITPEQIQEKLVERNLEWHLNRYDETDPSTKESFFKNTPFISTTAGTVERDAFLEANFIYSPFMTALCFATDNFRRAGYVFYGYVFTFGKKAVEHQGFAEEVRDLHIYTNYLPYHPEGEIVAKLEIPSICLQKYEKYDPAAAKSDLKQGRKPVPVCVRENGSYQPPEPLSNIRGLIE